MDHWTETDLAWELTETACSLFPESERIDLYIAIGAGYSYNAIAMLLTTIERANVPLSAALTARLAEWLNAYAYHADAPRLHRIVVSIGSAAK